MGRIKGTSGVDGWLELASLSRADVVLLVSDRLAPDGTKGEGENGCGACNSCNLRAGTLVLGFSTGAGVP